MRQRPPPSRPACATILWCLLVLALPAPVLPLSAAEAFPAVAAALVDASTEFPRAAATWLEVQVELSRRGFSGGSIDGIRGPQSEAALKAFQRREGLAETGELDAATREVLQLEAPALVWASLAEADLAGLQPLEKTWVGKSQQTQLAHETALELAAERFRAGAAFLRRINPDLDWDALTPDTLFVAPAAEFVGRLGRAARLEIRLGARTLEAFDAGDRLIAHFPVSIAKKAEKRPVGELRIKVAIANPDYTFDPAVFPESAEARSLGRKLILPPGPNNPVGVAWIGLDRPGYGIHGTPDPAKIGYTESHGCFRLANWDAQTLLSLVSIGLPVIVEP
ncbi:MAG: murein L,D-transpeptidase [Verrucomicrobia bacterium]|nr:murein L,D-transpeptidase [Verrucomicrobiota bacterium]